MKHDTDRRTFLAAVGGTVSMVALAGCSDDDNGDDDGGNGAPDDLSSDAHQTLVDNDANLYEGEVEDETGQDSVTVMNGAGEGFAYDAPAIKVDSGTEVTWEWTGEGGGHNVVTQDAPVEFESDDGELIDEEGHTWSYTFEETGEYIYACTAHIAAGQWGVVVVE